MSRIDPGALAAKIREIGKKVDNEPISLERGSYVSGTISTGSLIVNLMFGGGVPPGKWTTVWGPEMSGKTTMTMSTVAQALRGDDPTPVIYFDHEAAMDPIYAANLGIRTASKNDRTKQNPYFTYTQPTTGEQTYRMILRILNEMPDFVGEPKAGRPRPSILFVIDSLAAMSPEVLIEEDEKSAMAQGGRMHSDYMRRIKAILGRKNGSIFATNQLRVKPGFNLGDPSYEPGGEAVKFFADLKLFMRAVQKPFNERGLDMRTINLKTTKNKMFPPFKEEKERLKVAFGRGFERYYDGLGWLEMMNRVHVVGRGDKRKKSELKFGDKSIDGSYGTNELIELLYTNKFRRFADRYMASGDAFRDYLGNTSVAPDATVNPEDAGLNFEAQKAERNKDKLKELEKRVKGVPEEPEPTTPGKRGKEKEKPSKKSKK